ncbi:hypothetical protein [Streptosporangium sp. NBC_01756]|uniref:hypothetical protein n=1 Tax=Streptosporangium sp. NBC_01756 TaxID=2975950 RepID=UPI002DDA97EF|nr:hypothetical protein [Streptosporangium sp. NBC_01756]WSC89061.1 hypothetical protein OIE48_12965 [Streptosporangium sp. NBC_01756]
MRGLSPAQRAGVACARCGRAWLEDLAALAVSFGPGEPFIHAQGVVVTLDEEGRPLFACARCPPRSRPVRYWPDGTEVTLSVEAALDRIVAVARHAQDRRRPAP